MKRSWLNSPTLWKDSFIAGFTILATLETALAVSAISIDNIWGQFNWGVKLLLVLCLFMLIAFVTFVFKYCLTRKGVSTKIRGIKVNIRQGDIFEANGWKVIGCNEYFDTTVDDVIIARNTLNGVFIDSLRSRTEALRRGTPRRIVG